MNFLTKKELKLGHEFKKKGYVIINIKNLNCLDYIQKKIIKSTELKLNKKKFNSQSFLNNIHKRVTVKELNNFRVNIMKNINKDKKFKQYFYEISKELLDPLLGNELVMQKRISLSIQFPKDKSSLLPIHSDTWSGLSPFEAVAWLPLVNCYKTKSMYFATTGKSKIY